MDKPNYLGFAGCMVAYGASAGAVSACTASAGISTVCGWVMIAF